MIRIMTYNICNATGVNAAGESQPQDIPATAQVIRRTGADIAGLNELDCHTNRIGRNRDLATEIAAELGMHAAFGRAEYSDGGEYGNALVSRWPLEDLTVTLVSPATPDGEENRSVMAARVTTPDGPLRVMCTHFSWRHESLRRRAVETILTLLSDPAPTVLLGDLNAPPDSPAIRLLTQTLSDPAAARPDLLTFPAHAPETKIDYILVSPQIRVHTIEAPRTLASDHLPLVATLSVSV